jgi:hypothetical protein
VTVCVLIRCEVLSPILKEEDKFKVSENNCWEEYVGLTIELPDTHWIGACERHGACLNVVTKRRVPFPACWALNLTALLHIPSKCFALYNIWMPLLFLIYFTALMLVFLLPSMIVIQVISWRHLSCHTGKQMWPNAKNSWMTQGTGPW